MYHEGGVYIDIDRLCNIPLRDVFNPCTDQDWDRLIAIIQNLPFLETYVEAPPFNTLLYRGPSINFDKMDFYKSENIKHWTH